MAERYLNTDGPKTVVRKRIIKEKPHVQRVHVGYRGGIDMIVVLCLILLVTIGIVMVFSSSYYEAGKDGDMYSFAFRESVFALAGGVVASIFSFIPYSKFNNIRLCLIAYAVSIVLLILVLFIGKEVGGAKRWLFGFQPSEVAKVILIVTLACLASKRRELLTTFFGSFIYMAVLAVPAALTAIENLSTAIVMGVSGLAMYFIATENLLYPLPYTLAAILAVAVKIFSEGFRVGRIKAWLDPSSTDTGYQILQSLYSVASGGFFGLGLGASRQKLGFLPEAHNDIIFAVICEELGTFGALIVAMLFIILVWRGFVIALRHKYDTFAVMVATGFTTMIAAQAVMNMAVVTNTMPNTGIPLPFISYGGSSLMVMLAAMGMLLNISRYRKANNK
ncbi:MAG: cell division protein FtsW [Firmicutes bacterium]|nr:cell division protein FtsW [Bacillota bacterium]